MPRRGFFQQPGVGVCAYSGCGFVGAIGLEQTELHRVADYLVEIEA